MLDSRLSLSVFVRVCLSVMWLCLSRSVCYCVVLLSISVLDRVCAVCRARCAWRVAYTVCVACVVSVCAVTVYLACAVCVVCNYVCVCVQGVSWHAACVCSVCVVCCDLCVVCGCVQDEFPQISHGPKMIRKRKKPA